MDTEALEVARSTKNIARERHLTGMLYAFEYVLATAMPIMAIVYILNLLLYVNIYVTRQSYLAVMLSILLTIVFLKFPAKKQRSNDKVLWYDFVLIILGVIGPIYYAIVYPSDMLRIDASLITPFEQVLTLISLITILEATRRVMGLAMPIIASLFFVYGFTCQWCPSLLHGRGYDLARVTTVVYVDYFGVLGLAFDVAATIVIVFVLFGTLLNLTGAGDFINNIAMSLLGGVRGGPAKVACVASGLFGSISGLTTANIVTTGSFTIPMMKKIGYKPHFAAAVEAAASNGGQIMPSVMGIIAFLMADITGIPYTKICIAAAVPAIFYYFCMFVAIDSEAGILGLMGLPRNQLPLFAKTLANGWEYFVPPVLLVMFMTTFAQSVQLAGLYAAGTVILIALFRRDHRIKLNLRGLLDSLRSTTHNTLIPGCACACIGIMMGTMMLTGLGTRLSSAILDISHGIVLLILVLSAICCFILGMGVGSIPAYLMVASLIAPALTKIGISQMAAHLFVFYFAITSFLTPPVAVGAYVAAGIANSDPWKTGLTATRLAIVTFIVPFLFIYRPAILGYGSISEIILAFMAGLSGCIFTAWCLRGYSIVRHWGWKGRVFFGIIAACSFFPTWWADMVGFILGIPFIVREFSLFSMSHRRELKKSLST